MKDYIPPCWVALVKIKDAHYKSLAHYYGALIHERLSLQCSELATCTGDTIAVKLVTLLTKKATMHDA